MYSLTRLTNTPNHGFTVNVKSSPISHSKRCIEAEFMADIAKEKQVLQEKKMLIKDCIDILSKFQDTELQQKLGLTHATRKFPSENVAGAYFDDLHDSAIEIVARERAKHEASRCKREEKNASVDAAVDEVNPTDLITDLFTYIRDTKDEDDEVGSDSDMNDNDKFQPDILREKCQALATALERKNYSSPGGGQGQRRVHFQNPPVTPHQTSPPWMRQKGKGKGQSPGKSSPNQEKGKGKGKSKSKQRGKDGASLNGGKNASKGRKGGSKSENHR
jgi:hypothetical protein